MEITVKIDFTDRVVEMLKALFGSVIGASGASDALYTPPSMPGENVSPPSMPGEDVPPPAAEGPLPNFPDDKAKRAFLEKWCADNNLVIPPRTRTATLEGWYAKTLANSVSDNIPTPAAETATGDIFGTADPVPTVEYTREDVTKALQEYLAKYEADKAAFEKAKGIARKALNAVGATMVTDLKPEHFATIIKQFKG